MKIPKKKATVVGKSKLPLCLALTAAFAAVYFYVALPANHPLAERESIAPQEVVGEPKIVFNYNSSQTFKEWTTGTLADDSVVCTVDTAKAALDLVEAGVGIAYISDGCIEDRPGLRFIPLKNWHQALYMCILYDKWLEPPVWDFVEQTVKALRSAAK